MNEIELWVWHNMWAKIILFLIGVKPELTKLSDFGEKTDNVIQIIHEWLITTVHLINDWLIK